MQTVEVSQSPSFLLPMSRGSESGKTWLRLGLCGEWWREQGPHQNRTISQRISRWEKIYNEFEILFRK